jgi:hypothetical protein
MRGVPPQPPPCDPPIAAGKWIVSKQEITSTWNGTLADGTVVSGQILTRNTGDQNIMTVDCDGAVSAQGATIVSGLITLDHVIPGSGEIVTKVDLSGGGTYSFTGTAVAGDPPTIDTSSLNQSGSVTATTTISGVVNGFPIFSTNSYTRPMAPVAIGPIRLSSYDPDAGVLQISLEDNPWFQAIQANIDSSLLPQGLEVEQAGEITYESHTPFLESASPEYFDFFLKDVGIDNNISAKVQWRKTAPPHKVTFTYGGETQTITSDDSFVSVAFDMGKPADSVSVFAEAEGQKTETQTVSLPKVPVPQWAGTAADFTAAPGIHYHREMDWPAPFNVVSSMTEEPPLVGGTWNIFATASSKVKLDVNSQGSGTATLDGHFSLFLPKLTSVDLKWTGSGEARLTATDLSIPQANARITFPPIEYEKDVTLFSLVPGAQDVICKLSDSLCSLVKGPGVIARASISFEGDGQYHSAVDKLEWTQGQAKVIVDASATLNLTPPPIDKLMVLNVSGGGTACGALQFIPIGNSKTRA